MHLSKAKFENLNEESLSEFVKFHIKEDKYLDYKLKLSGNNKEFLKDISAFANADGENLFIGIKEPKEDLPISEILLGIEESNILNKLEQLAASGIEPRISGLEFKEIELSNSKKVIAIHIPPSFNKPHMVVKDNVDRFYIRHSESIFHMSVNEIKNSFLRSLTSAEIAKEYLYKCKTNMLERYSFSTPILILQIIPIIPLASNMNVFSDEIKKILFSLRNDGQIDRTFVLSSSNINIILEGINAKNGYDDDFDWVIEIHKNGCISLFYKNNFVPYENNELYFIHAGFENLFKNFFNIVQNVFDSEGIDLPCLISSDYQGADKTVLLYEQFARVYYSKTYYKKTITLPDQIHQVGENYNDISEVIISCLFNAYGKRFKT